MHAQTVPVGGSQGAGPTQAGLSEGYEEWSVGRSGRIRQRPCPQVQLPADSNTRNENQFEHIQSHASECFSVGLLALETDRPGANLNGGGSALPALLLGCPSPISIPCAPLFSLAGKSWLLPFLLPDPSVFVQVPSLRSQAGSQGAGSCPQEGFAHQAKCFICSVSCIWPCFRGPDSAPARDHSSVGPLTGLYSPCSTVFQSVCFASFLLASELLKT